MYGLGSYCHVKVQGVGSSRVLHIHADDTNREFPKLGSFLGTSKYQVLFIYLEPKDAKIFENNPSEKASGFASVRLQIHGFQIVVLKPKP